ncbi:PREDICTED: cystathionine beta-lyase-like [Priapulus caudatus]|uniref:Cystathionine beta-lyase-like n=1 Tax=Priapulus caudatus TaxID=37621 RepID=A0ABM1E013_PRICU|nr:PREDICTED: cystathionine beta-lyase-like [Priapulus caudatus]
MHYRIRQEAGMSPIDNCGNNNKYDLIDWKFFKMASYCKNCLNTESKITCDIMIFSEVMLNPLMKMVDLEALAAEGKSRDILTVVDATFVSPTLLQPLKLGIDIVVHSCSKYMGGHSDVIAGCVTTSTVDQWKKLQTIANICGTLVSPFSASILQRGLKTLPLRMAVHSQNAMKLAEFLEDHPKISRVMYPGLPSFPYHDVAKKLLTSGYSGIMSFEVASGYEGAKILVESLHHVALAVSLGGTESLIEIPAVMTHGPHVMTDDDRDSVQISGGLVRLSVGIEDIEDLKHDFIQALDKIKI